MTITIRRASSLGETKLGDAALRCHFSFRDALDGRHVHDGRLRVVNAGVLPAGGAFALGPEENIDILTWCGHGDLSATVEGFEPQTLEAGSLHAVSTASGVSKLAWASETGATFLQFWFLPDLEGGEPTQETRPAFPALEDGAFRVLASGFPEDNSEDGEIVRDGAPVPLRGNARLLHADIRAGEGAAYGTRPDRDLYLVVVAGTVSLGATALSAGDAAAIAGVTEIIVMATATACVFLTDTSAT